MFHVYWDAEIEAESDVDAAQIAQEMICDHDSFAPIFCVGPEYDGKCIDPAKYHHVEVVDELYFR